jgi:prevent-host-death family protein
MNISRDIQPLSTFKRETNKIIEQLEETGEPVVLTVHGKAKVIVQDVAAYQELLDQNERMKDRLEAIAGIRRGLEDMQNGRERSIEEFDAEFRKKHNISEETAAE